MVAPRWAKIMQDTDCTARQARVASDAIRLLGDFKGIFIHAPNDVQDYLLDKLEDVVVELSDGEQNAGNI